MDNKGNAHLKRVFNYDPFRLGAIDLVVPATEAQKEIWSTLKMDSDATLCYNESIEINFKGHVDYSALNIAFGKLIGRHDALRSVFSNDGKKVFVKEYSQADIAFIDLSQSNSYSFDYEAIKKKEVTAKYDLEFGPLVRSTLIKKSDSEFIFILSTHHIICDGWSYSILFHDLGFFYNKEINGTSVNLGIPLQFSEFSINLLQDGINRDHRAYWLNEFKMPLAGTRFPTDYPRGNFRTFKSKRVDVVIPESLVAKLKKVSAQNGSSLYGSLIAVFNIFISKLTKNNDVVLGVSSATQPAIDQNELVGHMVNLLPLRAQIESHKSIKDYLTVVRSKMLDAFDHQFYTYGTLVKDLQNIKRIPGELPLLNIVFNIDQQAPDQGLRFQNLDAYYNTIPREYENFDMFINAASCQDSLVLECQFNEGAFRKNTILSWFNSYLELLGIFCENPNTIISSMTDLYIHLPIDIKIPETSEKVDSFLSRNFETERLVSKIWSEILLNDNITETDNFFSIGGHSLLALELASKIEKDFSKPFSMKDVFENPNIILMAQKVSEINKSISKTSTFSPIEIQNLISEKVSNSQMQIWYLEEMFPSTTMHNLPAALRFRAKIDIHSLELALNVLKNRHEAFRTYFQVENGVPYQKVDNVDKNEKIKLNIIEANEESIVKILNSDAALVFNKSTSPLFKATVYKLSEEDYVLFFLFHHAIWDGWSFDIFFEELNLAYSAFSSNTYPQFSKPGISYLDYTSWLKKQIEEKKLDHELEYWKQKLHCPLPFLELPLDFSRPAEMSHVGGTIPFTLNEHLLDEIRLFARANGTSLFNVFLTAFKITLSRYSKEDGNKDDIIVGAPVRGRVHPEVMNTIGYFVNTVALRTVIDHDQSFIYNLNQVATTCLEAFENQIIPFQIVLNKVSSTKDRTRTPIFQTFFSYQDVNNRRAHLGENHYSQINVDKSSTHTDLDLWIKTSGSKIEGAFEFRKDLFLDITVERFLESFIFILESLSTSANINLNNAPLLPSKHKNLLKQWNQTDLELDERVFVEIFKDNARLFPNNVAVITEAGSLSYNQLDKLSNKVANSLKQLGVKGGDLVGVSLNRDLNLLPSILGIFKCGAGYVPLDPSFPDERLNYMIENSKINFLVLENNNFNRFNKVQNLFDINEMLSHPKDELQFSKDFSPESIAYVIYTSGSTGLPKGVSIPQLALSNFLQSMKNKTLCSLSDRLLAVTTLSFDISVLELFLPLMTGASVYIANSKELVDGSALNNIIQTQNITLMQATPTTWRLLLAAGFRGHQYFKALCGGEPFPRDLMHKLLPLCLDVWNMYGPTETTVWSTMKKLTHKDQSITIGTPIGNTTIYILDEHLNRTPIGVKGQLFIGGKGVALGYLNRSDLTSERFIKNPLNSNEIIYATGDFARFNAQGELICLGRNDGQVKLRGFRIELGEIESQLQKISGINESAVKILESKAGDQRLVAYYSSIDANLIEEKDMRAKLSKNLSAYMVPSNFVHLNNIPKTLNGKIDKLSLPDIFAQEKTAKIKKSETTQSPISQTKRRLYQIIKDLLRVDQVSDSDNFFDIGGNSLLAVEFYSKLAQEFNITLQLSLLIEAHDLDSFYQAVNEKINPSLRQLASINLIPSADQVFKSLVAISNKGSKNPFYCFHAVGGNILNYVSIVPAMKSERPLLAFQSVGLDGESLPLRSIEEMALFYYRELKLAQPEGPYLLAGGSMGGLIALEVARRIIENGDEVEKIIMFDTFGPNFNLKSYKKQSRQPFHKRILKGLKNRFKSKINFILVKLYRNFGLKIPLSVLLYDIEQQNYKAIWNYNPKKFEGDIYLIRSKIIETGWYSDPHMGWSDIIDGNIKIFEINSTHDAFIESPELVKVLGKIV